MLAALRFLPVQLVKPPLELRICSPNLIDLGLTRFSGHLSVYREGVSNGEQRNEVSSGVSEANGRIGLGGPQIWGPVQGVWSNGLDDPKMGQASRARC